MAGRHRAAQAEISGVLMFDDVVTVINHYYDAVTKEDKFNATVLNGDCMWREKTEKTVANDRLQVAKSISLTILYRSGYIEPEQYIKLSNDEKSKYFTLNANDNMDFIVLGSVSGISDYASIQEMKKKYRWATIASVSDNTMVDGLRHWKVTGR